MSQRLRPRGEVRPPIRSLAPGLVMWLAVSTVGCGPRIPPMVGSYVFVLQFPGADLVKASQLLADAFVRETWTHAAFAPGYPAAGEVVPVPTDEEPGLKELPCIPGPLQQRASHICLLLGPGGEYMLVDLLDQPRSLFYAYRVYVVSPFYVGTLNLDSAHYLGLRFAAEGDSAFALLQVADRPLRNALKNLGAAEYRMWIRP